MASRWRVGDPSAGPAQFHGNGLLQPGDDEIVVHVDDPDLARLVPQVHPGPLAAYAGGTDKRLVLAFDLPEQPTRPHRLTVTAFAVQGPVPELEIDVNGHRGLFFPVVERDDRDGVPGVSAISGWLEVVTDVEPHWLRAGENRLALTTTAVDDVAPLGGPHPELGPFWGSAVAYAGIALDELTDDRPDDRSDDRTPARPDDRSGAPGAAPVVSLRPLPLYVGPDDALAELVDVVVSVPAGGASSGTVCLEVAGQHGQVGGQRVTGALELDGRAFGQARVRLAVPEQAGECPARITVELDGRAHVTETTLRPCRKWTLHLLPHVHLDLGYTDFQAKVSELHARNLDRVLDILETHGDYAYSVDGSYVVEQYLRTRGEDAVRRFEQASADGRISVNAFYALFLSGLISLEECFRAGRHAAQRRRATGAPIDYANLTDVPSYSGDLPTVLGAMGVTSFLGIQNHGRAANSDSDELHLRSPFTWLGPDGSEVLTFFADCYAQLRWFAGYPVSVPGAAQGFSRFVARFDRPDYLPHDLPVVGIYSDNEDLADGEADFVTRWSKQYAYPRIRFSTVADYFAAVRPLQDRLPRVRGDGGSYWEDGVGAGAAIIARYRRAQVGLAAAEALAALVSTTDSRLRPSFEDLDPGWDALLIGCEHTWTSMHANRDPHGEQTVDQLAWKEHHVATAARVASDETRRSLSQLGERVTTAGPTLLVVNTLGWDRDVEVDVELPPGHAPRQRADVTVLEACSGAGRPSRVRLVVRAVPGFGYRTVPLERGPIPAPPSRELAVPADGAALELDTGRYRVRIEQGRVTSLRWNGTDRELLDQQGTYALGEVVHVSGGGVADSSIREERTRLHDTDPWLPAPDLDVVPADMRTQGVRRSDRATVITLSGTAPSLPAIEVELAFRDDDDRVDVRVRLEKDPVYAKESVYVAFPFDVPQATARYDRQVSWVDPVEDHLPGACNEWFTTMFGVGLEGADLAICWTSVDAPLFTLGDVVRGRWSTQADAGDGVLLSWVMNNHWWTNFPPAQEGPLELRYAFRPSADGWDPTGAARFGREVRAAPVVGVVGWLDKMDTRPRGLPADGTALLDVSAPRSIVATVVAGRVGAGCIVRLHEIEGIPAEVRITHPDGGAGTATRVTGLEDPLGQVPVDPDGVIRVEVAAHEVVSVRLDAAAGRGARP